MTTFISYSRANSDFAVRLARDLKAAGFNVWLDQLDIPTGARWDDEIEKALEKSSIFLIILSPESIESQNVKDEVGYAIDSGKYILPVVTEPCRIPLRVRRFQFVDFTNKPYEDSLDEIKYLLSNTKELAKRGSTEEGAGQLEIPPSRQEVDTQGKNKPPSTQAQKQKPNRKKANWASYSILILLSVCLVGIAGLVIALVALPNIGPLFTGFLPPTTQSVNSLIAVVGSTQPEPVITITSTFTSTPTPTKTPTKTVPTPVPNTYTPTPQPKTMQVSWEELTDGVFKDSPAVASWGPGRLDVFVRGMDDALWHKTWDKSAWSGWERLGGVITSSPTAGSWGKNRIDIFALGTDGNVWQFWWDAKWYGWITQGGITDQNTNSLLINAPAFTSWGPGRLDVFVGRKDRSILHKYFDGNTWAWYDWEYVEGSIYSSPSAVSCGVGCIKIVATGPQGQVLLKESLTGRWLDLGGIIQDSPAIASWGPDRLDIFVRGMDDTLWHKSLSGSGTVLSDWKSLGVPIYSSPAAVSWGRGRIDVFARGKENQLIHIWLEE